MNYQYDSDFFDFVNASSGRSARLFLDKLVEHCLGGKHPERVLDVGCGRGVWLAEWKKKGVGQICGLDGDYVAQETLLVEKSEFKAVDISKPFDLQQTFNLVQCLEVAEHIPANFADTLVENICRHGSLVLFSAAVPGQGGEFHVNEQPYGYWREKFESRGFRIFDAIRPHVRSEKDIEPWYRYNTFVFANPIGQQYLSESAVSSLLGADQPTANVASLTWKARCYMISLLPYGVTTGLARLKHRIAKRHQLPERTP